MDRLGKRILPALLMAAIVTGCAPLPDMVSTEKKEGETYSADEVRQVTVDQPFLLSGDYFRERNQEPTVELDNLIGTDEDAPPTEQKTPAPPEKPREPTDIPPSAPPETVHPATSVQDTAAADTRSTPPPATPETASSTEEPSPVKVGLIIDTATVPEETARLLRQMTPQAAARLPVLMADPEKVSEVMAGTTCARERDLACLSRALGIYPGVRMVVLVEEMILPDTFAGTLAGQVSLVDTGLLYRYPVMAVRVPVPAAGETETAVTAALQQVLAVAARKQDLMPWFCRVFHQDEEAFYISAGKRSGLEAGDRLQVVSGGRVVPSPTGHPAGWLPGGKQGMVEVTRLFGEDFAACRLVEGTAPTPADLLMRP